MDAGLCGAVQNDDRVVRRLDLVKEESKLSEASIRNTRNECKAEHKQKTEIVL